jgi:hypothetical protein
MSAAVIKLCVGLHLHGLVAFFRRLELFLAAEPPDVLTYSP